MGRPAASDVSALSGCVANGRQALHHVSSPPSKIPYGGFSPVRLQTGLRPQPSLPVHTGGLCVALPRVAPGPGSPSVWAKGQVGTRHPVQRPLARRRVILSHQVMAYYGLIRGSGPLPPISLVGYTAGLCPRARAQSFPTLLCVSFLPCRLPYPGGRMVVDCSTSIRGSLRPVRRGSALTTVHAEVGSRVGFYFGAAKFALCCGPAGCSPYTDKGFYSQACAPSGRP
jgi:hypothetical protein